MSHHNTAMRPMSQRDIAAISISNKYVKIRTIKTIILVFFLEKVKDW